MPEPDEEKLQKIFAILRGPEPDAQSQKALDAAWPDLVAKARAEADRRTSEARSRRRPIFLGAVALAACVVVALGVSLLMGTDPRPHHNPWELKAAHPFPTWPGDLTEQRVFEDLCRTVGADEAQKVALMDLVGETMTKLTKLPPETPQATIAAVHSDMRARMADRLNAEQKKQMLGFCAERDRGR